MPYDFSSLDQQTLKANIIAYIKEDATFADYNFDGSALNSIANLLTYVTLQQNFYLNMTTQELYLDTATLFRNAAAIAKSLNYIPYRMTPAKLLTDAYFVDSDENIEIPQHCKFLVDGVPFTTKTAFNFTNADVESIELWQMEITTETYTYANVPYELLHGTNIADDYVIVKVNGEVWTEYDPASTIQYDSKVYFLSFNNNDKLTVTFGDGVFGLNPEAGLQIEVIYGITTGADGNALTNPVLDQVVNETYDIAFLNTQLSFGGSASETLESIKINAPKFYESQNRIVTKNDYKVFIEGHAPSDVNLVNVWDGSVANPPIYGTVFITVKPNSALTLTAQQKTDLLAYLSDYTVMSIRNEIVDATYVYVDIDSTVYYYKNFGVSTTELRATIENNVQAYFDGITSFNTKLKYSNLVKEIDAPAEVSNNLTDLTYSLNFDQAPNHQYNFDVQNAITEGTIVNDYVYDAGGIIYRISDDAAVGTVTYATGEMSFETTMDATGNILQFKTDSDDFLFEASNLPFYSNINITFEGI